MARGTKLVNIRNMLKAEIGDFAGTNSVRDQELNLMLSTEQRIQASQFTWEFLEERWDVPVAPSQRFATFPTVTTGEPATENIAINMDIKPDVEVFYNQVYQDVFYGIGENEYNFLNPVLGQFSDPIQRWRAATNPNEPNNPNQFEVWPVPVTPQVIRFTGQRAVQVLSADTDTADLDDMLLVLFVAAKKLARSKQADAGLMLQRAQAHLQWLKQGNITRTQRRTLDGMGDAEWRRQRKLTGMTIIVR